MSTPRELYEAYRIMPDLRLHQLRVAAVGKRICNHFSEPIDTDEVVLACLFHDMGNIVKFDLGYFPEALEPRGREYWEQVKRETEERYGTEQHEVSAAIGREIGLSEQALNMIVHAGYRDMPAIVESENWAWKMLKYADLRVAPHGVVSLEERFADFAVRYRSKVSDRETLAQGKTLEAQIFAHASIQPEDITDATVAPLIEELSEYPVS